MQFDDLFWLSLLIIFGASVVTALVRARQRDKCLALLDDHHVTIVGRDGAVRWGDLVVSAGGVELLFDVAHQTRRGLAKSSALLFADDLDKCVALCRTTHALTDEEKAQRTRQIERSFRPGLLRRAARRVRNFLNTIRDALHQSLGLLVTSIGRGQALGSALTSQKKSVDQISGTLTGQVDRAYEPLLERHIGRPIVLELQAPSGPVELPGYLVDYTEKYVAVFNVDHAPLDEISLEVTEDTETEVLQISFAEDHAIVRGKGDDPLVVRTANGRDLSVVLLPGAALAVRVQGALQLEVERVRHLDVVCPRSLGRVRFGSDVTSAREGWMGLPPVIVDLLRRPED